jgi:hypothetical protein
MSKTDKKKARSLVFFMSTLSFTLLHILVYKIYFARTMHARRSYPNPSLQSNKKFLLFF